MGEWYEDFNDTGIDYSRLTEHLDHYLYFRDVGKGRDTVRHGWCSHCGEHVETDKYMDILYQPLIEVVSAKHNASGNCPICDHPITFKHEGRIGNAQKLCQYPYAAWVKVESFERVWVYGVRMNADFTNKDEVLPEIQVSERHSLMLLTPGRSYVAWTEYDYDSRRFRWRELKTHAAEPFRGMMYSRVPVYCIPNLDEIENSFLKYSMVCDFMELDPPCTSYYQYFERKNPIKYLCLYCEQPRLEMAMKLGATWAVLDYVYGKRKNTRILDWEAKSPDKFFRLSKNESKAYLAWGCPETHLRIYRENMEKRGLTFFESCELVDKYMATFACEIVELCNRMQWRWRDVDKLLTKCGGNLREKWITYRDYIRFAEKLGYDLSVHNVAFPKNLRKAHDNASKAIQAMDAELKEEGYSKRQPILENKYQFANGEYTVIVPKKLADIVEEGKRMKHCVGGYVDRHAEGVITIVFIRHLPDWNRPLYTMELAGDEMRQVQGYHNYLQNKPKGDAEEFIELYLKWLKKGSPRKKDGFPNLSKLLPKAASK